MKYSIPLAIFILSFSCNNRAKISEDLKILQSNAISLPQKCQITIEGKDTIVKNIMISKLKLVIYTDSANCSACAIGKMHLWNPFIKYAKKYNEKLKFYFIYYPSKLDHTIKTALRICQFNYPVLIDENGEFEKLNPHLPKNKAMHTFLLDENNKVILVGNPLYNKEIEKLFYKKTQELLSK